MVARSDSPLLLRLAPFLLVLAVGCEPKPRPDEGSSSSSVDRSARLESGKGAPSASPGVSKGARADAKKQEVGPVGAAASGGKERDAKFQLSKVERLVAIGDLHGDLGATRQALELASAIDTHDKWIGGNLTVVQTGDQLDRGDDEQEILQLLERLEGEARAAGGQLIVLNGNHETMNVLGDFRYVTRGALEDFHDLQPSSRFAGAAPEPYRERAAAFLPGGAMALRLSKRPLIVQVGDNVFVHGGVTPDQVRYGIDRLNAEAAAFMRGQRSSPPAPILDAEGPVWTRIYGDPVPSQSACETLAETLELLSAKRLIVGHTVQKRGITSGCEDRLYRIDVGLSSYYGGSEIEVLEIRGDEVSIKRAPRKSQSPSSN